MLVYSNMIVIRPARFLLLLLFVLLQCVAPLAHAHVNGDSVDQNVHIALADYPGFIDHHHDSDASNLATDGHHLTADEHHTAVVCMPSEYRCVDLNVVQPAVAAGLRLLVQCGHVAVQLNAAHLPARTLSPYQHPCSQAPPA